MKALNSTTVHVEWRPPRAKERNGIIRGYYVYYVKVDQNGDPIPHTQKMEDTNDMNKNEIVLTNLEPETRYQVSVSAYTRRGDGPRSRPRIIDTKGAGRLKYFVTSGTISIAYRKSLKFIVMSFYHFSIAICI